jgi:hypothetical protein
MDPEAEGRGAVGDVAVNIIRYFMLPFLLISIIIIIMGMFIYMVDAKSGGLKMAAVGGLLFGGTLVAMDKL